MKLRTLLIAAVLLSTPLFAQSPIPPVQAPAVHAGHHQGWAKFVGLSPEQKAQVRPLNRTFKQQKRALKQQFQSQLASILSPQQMAQYQAMKESAKANHQHFRTKVAWATVGVTPEQKGQIKAASQSFKSQQRQAKEAFFQQVQPLLSADQQSRLAEFLQSRHGRRKAS